MLMTFPTLYNKLIERRHVVCSILMTGLLQYQPNSCFVLNVSKNNATMKPNQWFPLRAERILQKKLSPSALC